MFDSGLGGLTVVREIRKQLPRENIVYFGDIARLPYGIKSKAQIINFSLENVSFLLRSKVKAIVIACNSSSSAAFEVLKERSPVPVIDVIEPAAKLASAKSRAGRIGLIATKATIDSRAYEKALKKLNRDIKVFAAACPLFVSLVEEGWMKHPVTAQVVKQYLSPLKGKNVDTLILGCTHYPLLRSSIKRFVGKRVKLIDSAQPSVKELASLLERNGLSYTRARRGKLAVYLSDRPGNFKKIGERFLGEKIRRFSVVRVPA